MKQNELEYKKQKNDKKTTQASYHNNKTKGKKGYYTTYFDEKQNRIIFN